MNCQCAETTYMDATGMPQRIFNQWHDCAYVRDRNALIPAATKNATVKGVFHPHIFTAEMNRLWAAANK